MAAVALAANPGPLARVWRSYERMLKRRPVATQAVTSAALWGLGDALAQRMEAHGSREPLDLRRVGLTAAFGGAVVGPMGHVWYGLLDKLVLRMGLTSAFQAMLFKTAADNLLYSPLYVLGFFAFGCLAIDGMTGQQFNEKLRSEFVPTMVAEAVLWPPYMAFVFSKVPVQHQLLAVNVATLFDVCFLSWIRMQGASAPWMAAFQLHQDTPDPARKQQHGRRGSADGGKARSRQPATGSRNRKAQRGKDAAAARAGGGVIPGMDFMQCLVDIFSPGATLSHRAALMAASITCSNAIVG